MPHVYIIPLDLQLPDDAAVDLFLMQLHSPPPEQAGAPSKIPGDLAERRGQFLSQFSNWVSASYCPEHPQRPFFLITPELSTPLAHTAVFETLLQNVDRPAVAIVGLEFLRWAEYRELVETLMEMPDAASWLEHGQGHHWVNAALIVVRDAAGVIHKYIQPKRNPSDPEAATHFPCRNLLVFQSNNQTQGAHLNFCVQICADFTNQEMVTHFRKACEERSPGRPLDFTFVLQRNEDQAAAHFKRSIQVYFAPPVGMVDTSHGSIIFINNARAAADSTDVWGDSMLLFPYQKWRMRGAATYWLRDDAPHNHQGVLMREGGPAAFWLRYRPQYLVNPIPGSGQPGPFVNNHALALSILDDVFPEVPVFIPIPPAGHWLRRQWAKGRGPVAAMLREAGAGQPVQAETENAYAEMFSLWDSAILADDSRARVLLDLYFCCFLQEGYPALTHEPQEWSSDAENGARWYLATLALLRLGLAAGALTPDASPIAHAHAGTLKITLIWGGNTKAAGTMIVSALERLAADIPEGYGSHVVILVSPRDNPDQAHLAALASKYSQDITKPDSPGLGPARAPDDITEAASTPAPIFTCDQRIWAAVCYTHAVDDARANVMAILPASGA